MKELGVVFRCAAPAHCPILTLIIARSRGPILSVAVVGESIHVGQQAFPSVIVSLITEVANCINSRAFQSAGDNKQYIFFAMVATDVIWLQVDGGRQWIICSLDDDEQTHNDDVVMRVSQKCLV